VFHPITDQLYVTEHGPSDNDEVNRILEGRNYGWPDVHGFCDDDVSGLNKTGFCAANNVAEPKITWTPTIAPSGLDYYGSDQIPEWKESLLFTSLRGASLYRLPLSVDGSGVLGQEILFTGEFGRLRDVLTALRGEVYLATSNRDGRGTPATGDDRIIVISR
jgi:glucose/arabinose dehydrogenase